MALTALNIGRLYGVPQSLWEQRTSSKNRALRRRCSPTEYKGLEVEEFFGNGLNATACDKCAKISYIQQSTALIVFATNLR